MTPSRAEIRHDLREVIDLLSQVVNEDNDDSCLSLVDKAAAKVDAIWRAFYWRVNGPPDTPAQEVEL